MQVDWSVELAADDPVLEMPWGADGGAPGYCDLKRHPERLAEVAEARRFPELAEFLAAVNSPASILESAKCDAWSSTEMNPDEDIFSASHKFGSYVDLVFADNNSRFSFTTHEAFVKRITELLRRVPEIPASAEFLVRRCYFRFGDLKQSREGLYITNYVWGYGTNEEQARQQWAIGMKLVENGIRQISANPTLQS